MMFNVDIFIYICMLFLFSCSSSSQRRDVMHVVNDCNMS